MSAIENVAERFYFWHYMTWLLSYASVLIFHENRPTPFFYNSSCATLRSYLSNSWALIYLVSCGRNCRRLQSWAYVAFGFVSYSSYRTYGVAYKRTEQFCGYALKLRQWHPHVSVSAGHIACCLRRLVMYDRLNTLSLRNVYLLTYNRIFAVRRSPLNAIQASWQ